ncbi:MAG: 3-deoxy-D-manno-octulosonic acid kinase [Pseudomonadota bacterium]
MYREVKQGNCVFLQHQDDGLEFSEEQFSADYWKATTEVKSFPSKRGESVKFMLQNQAVILRHYYRGGLVRNLITDQYLWLGKSLSRPWLEWSILMRAVNAGLPVPKPVAACVCRSGIFYRAAIIMTYLENTEILAQRLSLKPLPRKSWYQLGLLIRKMHTEGIRHADLNASNILIDPEQRFYLVDFDKARVMNHLDDWQWRPLFRLQRSLDKFKREQNIHFSEDDWQSLMDGYQS